MRDYNTNLNGDAWQTNAINTVWKKGLYIPGQDTNKFRKDKYGSIMEFARFGDTTHEYGWEIDHIMPVENGGTDELSNLQPLQWENNRKKSLEIPQSFKMTGNYFHKL